MTKAPYIKNFNRWKEEFKYHVPIKIRFSETDMFGHMNNVSPFIYFEEARIEYFKAVGLFQDFDKVEDVPVVADLQCDYLKQVFFGETIQLYVKANRIGSSSLDIHYMGVQENGDVCLTGRGSIVNINKHTGKPVAISNENREKILTLQN